ncbi:MULTISPECIES: glutaminase B [Aeromonas]|uniref:Glutaminase n=2 Tax=Aeromonas TaxID=642 RepID=T0QYQ0_AERSA|nr:glutaminase B [Aeromonas salmonicida]ATP10937.1 glutaminase [Aeromonas salmonicida subsp. pectinolytica 34mel]EQC04233.1 glutaminase [Aeromonas salmonicida subsp. pectinolytica 34mel]MBS2783522.1 glutaminase B [Aeromonas salmonicida]WCH28076.1 glutaminase B [Aeromonas salmonicida]VXA80471.1 putative glutaminase [Aeromonas salmonicida]
MVLSSELLASILAEVRPLLGQGKVADYIPALAQVPADRLGMAVCTVEGELFTAGDAFEPFSIQSISKALSLTLALTLYQEEEIWARVGKEPSGQPFNSLVQLEFEQGIPRNPFINAGALVVSDLLETRLTAPRQRTLELVRRLSGNPAIMADQVVARSEYQHSARNAAIAYLMKAYGNFENEVDKVLQSYFNACAIRMSCVDLARAFIYLANRGVPLGAGEPLLPARTTKQVNALLATCGLYDEAGDFAYRVGMPGKSGVGGGIIALIPGELSVCVWSPELNKAGNSLAGTAALELLAERLGRSIF